MRSDGLFGNFFSSLLQHLNWIFFINPKAVSLTKTPWGFIAAFLENAQESSLSLER